MGDAITENLTRQVAHLARLDLSDDEVKTFTSQLSNVLSYVDSLQQVDVTGVAPLLHPFEIETPMREDVVIPPAKNVDGLPRVLDSAPDTLNGGFKVPPIL